MMVRVENRIATGGGDTGVEFELLLHFIQFEHLEFISDTLWLTAPGLIRDDYLKKVNGMVTDWK